MDLRKLPVGLRTNMVPRKAFYTSMAPRKACRSTALRKAFSAATVPPKKGVETSLPSMGTVPRER